MNYAHENQMHTCDRDLVCTPKSLGPPDAIVEVELCLDGPEIAWNSAPSLSQCNTTVIRPLLSIIFQEGVWSCKPMAYSVSHTIVGMASITAERKKIFIIWEYGNYCWLTDSEINIHKHSNIWKYNNRQNKKMLAKKIFEKWFCMITHSSNRMTTL